MNNITMLPLNQLEHHPDNPRLDLGDLTELTESIRSQGVLQNLTVVPGHMMSKEEYVRAARAEGVSSAIAENGYRQMTTEDKWASDGYTVVIGNRRMEAAKLAGLEEVPCVISDMDYNTQIATMLTENMHRADLTLYEQAQGIQMMMDLGMTQGQISELTGFSRTTIKRRAEMARLDKETLKEKCTQLTMDDMDQLTKIRDMDKRNELLKAAGTDNFKWKITSAITEQKREDNYNQIKYILQQAGCIEKSTNGMKDFWQKYEYLPYSTSINLENYKAGENILPEDERQLYFFKEYSYVRFWAEKLKQAPADEDEEPEEPSAEEIARREEEEAVRGAWARMNEVEKQAKENREDFIKTLTVKQKDNRKALGWMIISLAVGFPADALGILSPDEAENAEDEDLFYLKWTKEQVDTNPTFYAEIMNKAFFDDQSCVMNKWRTSQKPEYSRNLAMITGYEWLEDFGYRISDDERAYLDGTLDCYGKAEE